MSAITPYLCVREGREALRWYVDALGAEVRGEPIVMEDGSIGHAELSLAGAMIYLSEAYPEIGVVAPEPDAGATVTLHVMVPDVAAVVSRAQEHGAILDRGPEQTEHGTLAVLRDPFGHRWMLNAP